MTIEKARIRPTHLQRRWEGSAKLAQWVEDQGYEVKTVTACSVETACGIIIKITGDARAAG